MRPSRSRRLATNFAVLIPMAKQIPWAGKMVAVLTPTTRPAESTSGPPELPGIQRGIGLNDVIDQAPGIRAQRPSQRAHHTRRYGGLKAIGRANGDGDLAHAQFLRVSQFSRDQARLIDANDRQIAGGILADQGRGHMTPVGQSRRYRAVASCTTWLLVRIRPSGVKTNPEPPPWRSRGSPERVRPAA